MSSSFGIYAIAIVDYVSAGSFFYPEFILIVQAIEPCDFITVSPF